jgi:hypothetical protein
LSKSAHIQVVLDELPCRSNFVEMWVNRTDCPQNALLLGSCQHMQKIQVILQKLHCRLHNLKIYLKIYDKLRRRCDFAEISINLSEMPWSVLSKTFFKIQIDRKDSTYTALQMTFCQSVRKSKTFHKNCTADVILS